MPSSRTTPDASVPGPDPAGGAARRQDVVRLFGHPLHALVVHVPIGLLAVAPFFDVAAILLGSATAWTIGFWTTLLGVGSAVLVAMVGFADFLRSVEGAARRTAIAHMAANLGAVAMYSIALVVRGGPSVVGSRTGLVLVADVAGLGLLSVAGWLGGELVFRHRIGAVPEPTTSAAQSSVSPSAPHPEVHDDAA